MQKGLVHYYFGDGKGKTTAALGLAMRAAGHGGGVVIVQFLKNSPCGEENAIKKLPNITLLRGKAGAAFTFSMTEEDRAKTKAIHEQNLREALKICNEQQTVLLVLDEATDAVLSNTLDEALLKQAVLEKPEALEIVVTGHKPLEWLVESADYITEMKKHRHPFDKGIKARKGVEF